MLDQDQSLFDDLRILAEELTREIEQDLKLNPDSGRNLAQIRINELEQVRDGLLNKIKSIQDSIRSDQDAESRSLEGEELLNLQSLGDQIDIAMYDIIRVCLTYINPVSEEFLNYARTFLRSDDMVYLVAKDRLERANARKKPAPEGKGKPGPKQQDYLFESLLNKKGLNKIKTLKKFCNSENKKDYYYILHALDRLGYLTKDLTKIRSDFSALVRAMTVFFGNVGGRSNLWKHFSRDPDSIQLNKWIKKLQ